MIDLTVVGPWLVVADLFSIVFFRDSLSLGQLADDCWRRSKRAALSDRLFSNPTMEIGPRG